MEQIAVDVTPTSREVGMCREKCGSPATMMVTAGDRNVSGSTFVCAAHRRQGSAHALRMLSDMLRRGAA
jgi:hypothetical protein